MNARALRRLACRLPSPLLVAAALGVTLAAACNGAPQQPPVVGQTSFVSAPPAGQLGSARSGPTAGNAEGAAGDKSNSPAPNANAGRTVEETDLYRLEGTTL